MHNNLASKGFLYTNGQPMNALERQSDTSQPSVIRTSHLATQCEQKLGCIIGQSGKKTANGELSFQMILIDLDNPDFPQSFIPVPFLGHGLAFHPNKPGLAVLFEKRGPGACEINLETLEVNRVIPTKDNRHFYGHGTYSADGKILYASETIIEGKFEGAIIMRDSESMEEIGSFPSYGARPHDCQLLSDKRTMIITNGGGMFDEFEKGSVTYVDTITHSLLKKLPVENKKLNAGHVAVAQNGSICLVSAPREGLGFEKYTGGISIAKEGDHLTGVNAPRKLLDKLKGETLSVCIDNTNNTAVTMTPDAGEILFWDLAKKQLRHRIKKTHPRGVCLTEDKQYFVINYGRPSPKISLLDTKSFSELTQFDIDAEITGSHIVTYRRFSRKL